LSTTVETELTFPIFHFDEDERGADGRSGLVNHIYACKSFTEEKVGINTEKYEFVIGSIYDPIDP
jgi:hypothetical protein